MSSAFTIANRLVQKASSINEVVLAYNERRAAVHQAPRQYDGDTHSWSDGAGTLSPGDKVQHHALFTEIQAWIEANCGKFMPPGTTDYHNTVPGDFKTIAELAGATDPFEYFCTDIVGGNLVGAASTYGWRRSVEIGVFTTRGQAARGDYIRWSDDVAGYFDLWEDIRDCLSAMKVTRLPGFTGYDNPLSNQEGEYWETTQNGGTIEDARAGYPESTADNAAAPWAGTLTQYPVGNYGYFMFSQSAGVRYYLYDGGPSAMYALVSAAHIYISTEALAGGWDAHGQSVIEGKLAKVADFTPVADGLSTTPDLLQVLSGNDFGAFGGDTLVGWQSTSVPWYGIVVWNFSHSN